MKPTLAVFPTLRHISTIRRIIAARSRAAWMPLWLFWLVLLALATSVTSAATITWTGAVSSDWNTAGNWSPAQVPTNVDTVIISSGTVTFASNSQFAVLNFNGGYIVGPVVVSANTVMNWSAGRLAQGSSLLVASNALLNLTTTGEKDIGGPMNNYGHVAWTGGSVSLINDGTSWFGSVVNLGLWEMQGDWQIGQWFGNELATFSNGGIFRKSAGVNAGTINLPFLNAAGILQTWSGALQFGDSERLDGLFVAGPGTVIQFNNGTFTYTAATSLVGDGLFQLTGGTLQGLLDALPNLQLLSGTVLLSPSFQTNGAIYHLDLNGSTLAGTYQVSGVLNFNSGLIAGPITVQSNAVLNWNAGRFGQGSSLVVASNGVVTMATSGEKDLGGALTNFGTITWTGGTCYVFNDGISWAGTIQNFGLWEIQGDLGLVRWFGNDQPMFSNNGLVRKSLGTGITTLDTVFLNQGTLEALSGLLSFTRDFSCPSGTVTFGLSNNVSFGQISAPGTITLNGNLGARLLGGYIPDPGVNFTVLSANAISGSFTNTTGLNVGFGRRLVAAYTATNLVLQTLSTNGVNGTPTWATVPNFNITEGQTLLYTNQVSDADGDQVLFALLSAPTGASVNLTNGIFSWTPAETQGGTSNWLTMKVFDSGNPSVSLTQSFYVRVLETNTAPVLPVIPPQLIGVGSTLTVTNTATDSDLPVETLSYTLLSPPAGASIDANGVITYNPGVAGNYQITTRVTDNGSPALSATNTFTVGVLTPPTPPSGLVSWWTGNGTTADANGVNNGALSGNASYAPGIFGQAFNFAGGYLTVLDSPSLDFAPGAAMTVEMWVQRTQPGYPAYYFGKRVSCGTYNYQSPSDQFTAGTAYDPPVGVWRHYAWVFTGTEMLGYVNGALVYRTQTTLGPINAAALFIGSSGTCNQPFYGLIDEARLYNRALTAAEVAAVYGAQNAGIPVLTQLPASQLAASGSTVILAASATGQSPLSYQWLYNGSRLSGQTTSSLSLGPLSLGQSGQYSVTVSNTLGSVTSPAAELTVMNAPAITQDPQSQTGVGGGSVTLTVVATGAAPLSYQWRKNTVPISGATGSAFTLSNLQTTDAGNYDVVAMNWVGSATSHVAILSVPTPLVWTGVVSSDWTNPGNWNPQRVPTSTDTAIINSGNVVIAPSAQFYALTFTAGTISGPVLVATNCVMNWSGGRLNTGSSLTIAGNALLNLLSTTEKDLGGPMTNFGHVVWSGGNFTLLNDGSSYFGSVTNLGLWEMQSDLTLNQWFGNDLATFGNAGVFRKTGGTSTAVISLPFFNTAGTLDVESGTLRFDHSVRLDGTWIAGGGCTVLFNTGTFTYVPPSHLTGAGQYQLTGGTLQGLDDNLPNLSLASGTVLLSPTFQTNGVIVRLDLAGATLGGSSNQVVGVLNTLNGNISGALELAPNAVANINNTYLYGPTYVRSNATFNWFGGRFAQGSSLLVVSNGLLNMLGSGEKDFGGPFYNYGHVVWNGGAVSLINDASTWFGSVVNLGLWEEDGDVSLSQWFGNDLAVFGNGGIFRKSGGTGISSINLPFYNTFGAVEIWTGTLQFNHGEQLDGLYTVDAGAVIQLSSGTFTYTPPGRFLGSGQYQLTSGTLSGLSDSLPNWVFLGGTVILSPAFQTNGAIVQLNLDGTTLVGANQVNGVLNFNSGYISGSLTINSNAVLNWNGGRFLQGSTLLVASNGLVNLQSNNEKDLGGPMTNYGTALYTGGPIYVLNDGASWTGSIENFGLWDVQADNLALYSWFGNNLPVFANYGTVRKSLGTGTSTIGVVFTNQATLEPLSGSLSFSRGLACPAGTVTFGLSNNATFGQVTVSGTATLNGNVGARLLNGFIPDVGVNFPVLSASAISGSFTNTNSLNVGFGRQLAASYTTTTLTLQTLATNGVNSPPVWSTVPNFSISEGQTLLYTNQVSDPDGDQVLFALLSAATGASVNLTNGIFSWTPAETQGGTSNWLTMKVFDSGNPSLSLTQSFYVRVLETNTAPVLPVIPPQLIGVGSMLTVSNMAVDTDLPVETLTYSFLSAPPGANIDANGTITWTPAGPGSYQFTTRVTDNGSPALSATNTFTVGVISPPVPPAGLVSWWSGDGTTADKNGLNNGALSVNAGYAPGLFGQAFNFTGGYLQILDSASLDFVPGSALTVEMWVKRTQPGPVPYFFGKRAGCGSYNYESPSDLLAGANWNVPVGQWQHLAWVFTGAEMLAYVDGGLVYRTAVTLGAPNDVPLLIGASGTCGQTFVGLVDEVRLYNRALAQSEIQALYGAQNVGPPVIVQQPLSQLVRSGTTATLTASATGLAPLTYQWFYNGSPLSGKTSSTLTLNSVVVGQSGNYNVVVSNSLGVATSDVAGLTIVDAPFITQNPQSQIGVVGGSVTFTVTATGTGTPVLTYQWRMNGVPISGATSTSLTLNGLATTSAGTYDVVVANWAGTATSQPATLTISTPIVWTGAVSTDWNNRTNWNPQQVPTSADTAVVNSGNVVVATNAQFYALTFTGGNISGPVVVETNCLMNWSGGRLTSGSSLTIVSNALLNLTTATEKDLGGPMTNFGHVVWNEGSFVVMNDGSSYFGSISNASLWEMQGDLTLGQWFNNNVATFGNSGTFVKDAGTAIGVLSLPFVNGSSGTVDVETTTLRFDQGLLMNGSLFAQTGAIMLFNAGTFTYVPPSRLVGPGQYQFVGGTLQGLNDYVPNLQLLGGTVLLSPTYQTNGMIFRLDLNGSTLGGTSNRVIGTLNATNGGISSALEVAPLATLNLNGTYAYGPTFVRSNATFNWWAGRLAQGSSLLLESNAVVNLLGGGEKDIGGPMTSYGHVVWTGGSVSVINDGSTWFGTVTNLGYWEMQGDLGLSQWFGNDLAAFVNLTIFRKTAGTTVGAINLPFYNTQGTLDVESGSLRFDHSLRLDGVYIAAGGSSIIFNNGNFTYVTANHFTGAGLYQLTGGTLQGLDNYLPNLLLSGGTVILSPTYQTNGLIVRLDVDGAILSGSNTVIGVLNATNGNISGPLQVASNGVVNLYNTYASAATVIHSNATLNWLGGRFAQGSSLLLESNAVLNMLTGNEKDLGGPMTNFGHVFWNGGSFSIINDGSSWFGTVTNIGIWDLQSDDSMSQWFGNDLAVFGNHGLVRKSAGSGSSAINLPFNNAFGTLEAASGTIRFDHGQTLSGLFRADAGAIIQFNNGNFAYTTQNTLTGAGVYQLINSGNLQNLGDYLPNLQLLGGTVNLSPTYQTNGSIVRLDLNGSTLVGSYQVSGMLNLLSGYIGGALTVSSNGVLNWSSGRFAQGSSLLIQNNGLANLLTGGEKDLGGPLTNSGAVEWIGGTIYVFNDAATWQGSILNVGLWEVQGDLSMNQYYVNNYSSFQNDGTLRKAAGTGTAILDLVFLNQGVIEQLSGAWTFGRNFSLTAGTVLFGISGDNSFGSINLAGTASLAGRLAARLLNGYVPAVGHNFQVMTYGVVAGSFTDNSGLDVGFSRAFSPVYSANNLTLVAYATNSLVRATPIVLSNPAHRPNQFTFHFTGDIGTDYAVQYRTNIAQTNWTQLLMTNIPVSPATVTNFAPLGPTRFYRVIAAP